MDHPLGNALPVEMADLLQELVVLEGRRTAGPYGALVLVIVNRVSLPVGQHLAPVVRPGPPAGDVRHDTLLWSAVETTSVPRGACA
jgi:hypothetical protein